jgi:hypothetical protein
MAPKAALLLLKQPIDFANYLLEAGWGLFIGSFLAKFHPAFFGRAFHRVLTCVDFPRGAASQTANLQILPRLTTVRR